MRNRLSHFFLSDNVVTNLNPITMKTISEMINESVNNAKLNLHGMIQSQQMEINSCMESVSRHLINGEQLTGPYNLRQKFTFLGSCKATKQTMIEFFEGMFDQTYEQYCKEMQEMHDAERAEGKDME